MVLRPIPPIQCLLAFEAVARLHHARRAAAELGVTPSAVSHRLHQLELRLGFKLFDGIGFTLTPAGADYLAHVCVGLEVLKPPARRTEGGASNCSARPLRP